MRHDSVDWSSYFEEQGFEHAEVLGRGMEGLVYSLGADLAGKIWFNRPEGALRTQEDFYQELRRQSPPFSVPEILDVRTVRGSAVTIQRRLAGVPLRDGLESGAVTPEDAQECVLTVLRGLAETVGGPASRALPVLDEQLPLWRGHATWSGTLGDLIHRRVGLSGGQLRTAVVDFDAKLGRIFELLDELPVARGWALHGDLCPANVLVDGAGRPTAVLDWGFLTTSGDPAFDASVAAGIFDMYGPEARRRDDELTDKIVANFGYSRARLLLYRAVYAAVTSNAYDPAGRDGHFAWCAAALNREDVTDALFSRAGV